jgi:hypothetical protein
MVAFFGHCRSTVDFTAKNRDALKEAWMPLGE